MITLITVWSTSTPAGFISLFNIISDISLLMKLPSRFSNDHKHIDFNSILFQNKNSKQITSITFLSHPPPLHSQNSGALSGSNIRKGQRSGGGISVGASVPNQSAAAFLLRQQKHCFTKLPKALKIVHNFFSPYSFFVVLHI